MLTLWFHFMCSFSHLSSRLLTKVKFFSSHCSQSTCINLWWWIQHHPNIILGIIRGRTYSPSQGILSALTLIQYIIVCVLLIYDTLPSGVGPLLILEKQLFLVMYGYNIEHVKLFQLYKFVMLEFRILNFAYLHCKNKNHLRKTKFYYSFLVLWRLTLNGFISI